MAVMAPTGSSVGATMVRARVSASNDGDRSAERRGGNQQAIIGAEEHAHDVRHKQAHVADGAADGDGQAREHRCGDVDDQLDARNVHAEMHGLSFAGEQDRFRSEAVVKMAPAAAKKPHHQDPQQAVRQRSGEIAHQPEGNAAEIAAGERGHQEHDRWPRETMLQMMPASSSVPLSSWPWRRPRK